jgi:glutathione S-transferase
MTPSIRLHRFALSGHAHRAELMLSLLGLPHECIDVDLVRGEHRQAAFLALNPFGQVPVIEDGAVVVADSNAILVYLATRYDPEGRWLPRDPVGMAQVQRWLGAAAGFLLDGPGSARVEVLFGRPRDASHAKVATRLFEVMERHLAQHDVLVGEHPTVADVAMYTYTSHAPEGGISLAPYPAIRAWLARIEALPGFVGMVRSPEASPLAA